MNHDAIAVIDFGGQYAHLIATKIRRLHVLAEIRQPEDPIEVFRRYKGIIISGSPSLSSFGEDSAYNKAIYDLRRPDPRASASATRRSPSTTAARSSTAAASGARPTCRSWPTARSSRASAATERVWMSHFDSVTERRPGLRGDRLHDARRGGRRPPLRRHRLGHAPPLRLPVPPRGRRHGPRRRDDRQLRASASAAAARRGRWSATSRSRSTQVRRAGRRPVRVPAGLGRRRLDGGRAACWAWRSAPERLHLLHVDNGLMRKDESRARARDVPASSASTATSTSSTPSDDVPRRRSPASSSPSRSA